MIQAGDCPSISGVNFQDELAAAFGEISAAGMPVAYKLSGEPHSGVVRSLPSEYLLQEPGLELIGGIVIASPLAQFPKRPQDGQREVVEVLEGPQCGSFELVGVQSDAGHYYLTCKPKQ